MNTNKQCTKCHNFYNFEKFAKDSRNQSGIKSICKSCDAARKRPRPLYQQTLEKLKDPKNLELEEFEKLLETLRVEGHKLLWQDIKIEKTVPIEVVESKFNLFIVTEFNCMPPGVTISEASEFYLINFPEKYKLSNTQIKKFIFSLKN